ncbi:MFS transporter [Olleya sp. UBA1516]|uniref:MFS transporter n=1 Tax=Olleya sp. UBA1516 TaxID=1947013 RepID=UPI0025FBAA51|nr:MFS transporter [Olleya sp. UBA1516]|tara:strand:+ start:185432 stop:186583 length:1152 start_codon:yes stop_codon:yes gene_type:complete
MTQNKPLEITLLLASMLTMLANAIIAPSLPAISNAFNTIEDIEALTKLMLTLPALTIAIISPIAGRIIDTHGRIKVLIISLIIYALAGTSGYWLNDIYFILIGRVILGIGVAGIMTTSTTLVGDYFEGKKREHFMGLQGAFNALGGLLFIPTAGYLADLNWHYTFLVYAFAFIVIVLVPIFLHEPIHHKKHLENDANLTVNKSIWLVYLSAFITMLFFYMIPVQLPFLLKTFSGVSANLVGIAIGTMMISLAISAILSKKLRQQLTFLSMYIIGFLLMAIGFLIIGLSTSYLIAVIGVIVVGSGIGSLIPNTNLWIMSLVPIKQRGKYVGKLTRFNFLGMFMSPIAIQPIQNVIGLQNSFIAVSIILMLLSAIYFLIIKLKKH